MMIIALIALKRGQNKMYIALDGKLTELIGAKMEVAKAQGKEEERREERDRVAEAVPVVTAAIAQAAVAAVKADPETVQKMQIMNEDDNAVPTRTAKPTPKTGGEVD